MTPLANIALFQVGWFACVLGAANGLALGGTLTALAIAVLHVGFARRPRLEMQLLLTAVALGFTWDSLVAEAGLITYTDAVTPALAPHWMAALWLVFATTLNSSLRWLHRRLWLAALLGAVGGPMAYYAGAQLGALSFPEPTTGLVAQALGWALLMPLLVWVARRLDGMQPRAFGESVRV